jgi:glycosyltransferase involved in cell wall biosynthesis
MRIVMLSDLETQGGAAIAASGLAEAMCRAGHRVTRIVHAADRKEHSWSTIQLTPATSPFLPYRAAMRLLPGRYREVLSDRAVQRALSDLLTDLRPDVINVHNVHSATSANWSCDLLSVCVDHAATIWTLHDMWSFTGRCAYSYDCRKFLTGCDQTCPTPTEYPALASERIAQAWSQRQRILAASPRLAAVAPSRWLAREARSGLWAGHRVEVIPYGVPLEIFRPLDRILAREALGIEARGPVLLMAAQNLVERRKGGTFLIEALRHVACRPLTVVTLGAGRLHLEAEGIQIHPLGFVDHARTKVLAYSAADLFLHPAPVDNLPNVVLESIACGTPVVGFPVGGVPDIVRPGKTGWLAHQVSARVLAETIEAAISDLRRGVDLRSSCRALAEAEYDLDLQARRYAELCHSLADLASVG